MHGYLDELVAALSEQNLIDADGHWAAGNARLWFLGDFTDRGPDGIGVIDLVMRLSAEAAAAGGYCKALMGNHELLLIGAKRFGDTHVSSGAGTATFQAAWLLNGGQRTDMERLQDVHLQWMSRLDAVVEQDGHLLMHSDTTAYLDYGSTIEDVNETVHQILTRNDADECWDLFRKLTKRFAFRDGGGPQAVQELLSSTAATASSTATARFPISSAKSAQKTRRTTKPTRAPWWKGHTYMPTDLPSPWTVASRWRENCWWYSFRWTIESTRTCDLRKPPVTSSRNSSTIGLSVAGSPPFPPTVRSTRATRPYGARGMHMNSAPHLLSEDRADFERILDDALRNAHDRPDLAEVGKRLNAEQLRTMALNATALITTAAAAEYEHYATIREESRSPATAASVSVRDSVRDSVLEPDESEEADSGAGFTAVITVLVPVLGGTAAAIFLLVGYLLKALDPAPAFADSMLAVGWFFGAVTVIGILAAAVGLLITALRNGATQLPAEDSGGGALSDEVGRAREAWRHALLERGVLPFLRAALADPSADPAAPRPTRSVKSLPTIGYSRPDYSSPGEGSTAGRRPTFTSPDFTSPDFGGPEHKPE